MGARSDSPVGAPKGAGPSLVARNSPFAVHGAALAQRVVTHMRCNPLGEVRCQNGTEPGPPGRESAGMRPPTYEGASVTRAEHRASCCVRPVPRRLPSSLWTTGGCPGVFDVQRSLRFMLSDKGTQDQNSRGLSCTVRADYLNSLVRHRHPKRNVRSMRSKKHFNYRPPKRLAPASRTKQGLAEQSMRTAQLPTRYQCNRPRPGGHISHTSS